MKIQTESLTIEDAKDPQKCNVFKLYQLIAETEKVSKIKKRYLSGGIGYGEIKELLYTEILDKFSQNRAKFFELHENKELVEELLIEGSNRARQRAQIVLKRVRTLVGY